MKYTKVEPANELGFAKVVSGEGETHAEGIIDTNGVEIIPPRMSLLVNDITGSTALVQSGHQFLFVNLDQGPVDTKLFATMKGYDFAEPFRCDRAMVKVADRWFYIDTASNKLFGTDYDFAESFHHDRAKVKEGDRYRIIDIDGKTVARMDYDQISPFTPWRWQVTKITGEVYLSGFVDLDGKEVVPLIYDEMDYFQPDAGRTRAGINGKLGYLDELGEVAIPLQFEYAEIFDKSRRV